MSDVFRIGVDVGGTNTDGALLDSASRVVAKIKTPTTSDVLSGVSNTLAGLLERSGVPASAVGFAMLSTTACTNAVTTRDGLVRIGVLRLGAPATTAIPPLTTWPADLRDRVLVEQRILRGGHEFHGGEIAPLNDMEVHAVALEWRGRVEAVAISSVFSPINPAHEERAGAIVRSVLGDAVPVTLSHDIGSLNLLERENAAALNAALTQVAKRVVTGFRQALTNLGLGHVHAYLSQNDGTLMSLEMGVRFPVLTIACGPANSIRGAALLSGVRQGLVVDIGGTTTDAGVLMKGFPRESSDCAEIGGVRTNFRMPDILSIGLGGGSLIHMQDNGLSVGPDTVGYRLRESALVFGGTELTATDLAVAAGRGRIGDPALVSNIDEQTIDAGMQSISSRMSDLVDRMKLSDDDIDVIVVGGGSLLFPDSLPGVGRVIRPEHYEVANAIGVATAQVSATLDRVFSLTEITREAALSQAQQDAVAKLLEAGGSPDAVEILELEDLPLPYLGSGALRVRVKVAAPLAAEREAV